MNRYRDLKLRITNAVLSELDGKYPHELTIDQIIDLWFLNPNQEGLRLSFVGNANFEQAGIEFFEFDFEKRIDPNGWYGFLLDMSKKIKCPYYLSSGRKKKPTKSSSPKNPSAYIHQPYVRLYDSKIAMMVGLYGTMKEYLDSINIPVRKY